MLKLGAENGKLIVIRATPPVGENPDPKRDCTMYLVRGYKDGVIVIVPVPADVPPAN